MKITLLLTALATSAMLAVAQRAYTDKIDDDTAATVAQYTREALGQHLAMQTMAQQMAAAERLASLGTLAAGLAHELNQPRTVIKSASIFLKKKTKQQLLNHTQLSTELVKKQLFELV